METKKQGNAAISAFKDNKYPKGYIRNRILAAVVDLLVVTLLCQLAFILFGQPDWQKYIDMQELVAGMIKTDPLVIERMALYQTCFITTLMIGAAYEALTMIFFKASIGKLIFRLRVVDQKPDRHFILSKLMLIVRAAVKGVSIYLLSAIPFIFLCLTVFGNNTGRSGFDLIAGTRVADKRIKEETSKTDDIQSST